MPFNSRLEAHQRCRSILCVRTYRAKVPGEEVPGRLMGLLLELLKSDEQLPELVVAGLSLCMAELLLTRHEVGRVALQKDIYGTVVTRLHKLGRPGDWAVRHSHRPSVVGLML